MEFGTALLLPRTQILQNGQKIYIPYNSVCCIHFKLLQIQLNYWNCLNFNFNVHRPPSALEPQELSFQPTNQKNELLAKDGIAHKVL